MPNMNTVILGINFLLALVALIFLRLWRLSVSQKKTESQQNLVERKHKQLLDRQENLGNRIYNALEKACTQNTLGKMQIERTKKPGETRYSIYVGWKEDFFSISTKPYLHVPKYLLEFSLNPSGIVE